MPKKNNNLWRCIVLINLLLCSPLLKGEEKWQDIDKIYHFTISGGMSYTIGCVLHQQKISYEKAVSTAFFISISIGSLKELYDKFIKKTHWSWSDFIWDVAGTIVGSYGIKFC